MLNKLFMLYMAVFCLIVFVCGGITVANSKTSNQTRLGLLLGTNALIGAFFFGSKLFEALTDSVGVRDYTVFKVILYVDILIWFVYCVKDLWRETPGFIIGILTEEDASKRRDARVALGVAMAISSFFATVFMCLTYWIHSL